MFFFMLMPVGFKHDLQLFETGGFGPGNYYFPIMIQFVFLFPLLYNTTDEVRSLATVFLRIAMMASPLSAFANAAYFTLRAGGKTWVTFLFDSVILWCVRIPMVRILIYYTNTDIRAVYAFSAMSDILKDALGLMLIRKGIWVHNIVQKDS